MLQRDLQIRGLHAASVEKKIQSTQGKRLSRQMKVFDWCKTSIHVQPHWWCIYNVILHKGETCNLRKIMEQYSSVIVNESNSVHSKSALWNLVRIVVMQIGIKLNYPFYYFIKLIITFLIVFLLEAVEFVDEWRRPEKHIFPALSGNVVNQGKSKSR